MPSKTPELDKLIDFIDGLDPRIKGIEYPKPLLEKIESEIIRSGQAKISPQEPQGLWHGISVKGIMIIPIDKDGAYAIN